MNIAARPARLRPVLRAVATAALTACVAAACANAPVAAPAAPTAPTAAAPSAPVTDAERHQMDVNYAQAMLPHTQQGLELTTMTSGRLSDPDLARLVLPMDRADAEEQGQLVGQLHAWSAPVPGERGVPTARMTGMADDATLDRLRTLSGPAFDRVWLAVMITHHQGGVDMSRDYLARDAGGALAGVAETTVEVAGRQIDQMRALQTRS